MRFEILTIFPELFRGVFEFGIIRRAVEGGLATINVHDLRDFTSDRHHQVDDRPFGGGAGMVMKPEPIFRAVDAVTHSADDVTVVMLSPQGRLLTQRIASDLAARERVVLICGRYEGVDERVVERVADDEISIGDYVLSGGEIPAMVVVDAVTRLLPGALGCSESAKRDSFVDGLLDYPHYTRPAEYRGLKVPDVLISGHHAEIESWRRRKAMEKTYRRRPELIDRRALGADERRVLEEALRDID